jgi:hypothetical protein
MTLGIVPAPLADPVNVGEARVSPDKLLAVAPKLTLVLPSVTLLLVSAPLPMLLSVLDRPEIDLLVRVSVVVLPTSVSVMAGRVNVKLLAPALADPSVVTPVLEPSTAGVTSVGLVASTALPVPVVATLPRVPALL